jgi:hypothetical protein
MAGSKNAGTSKAEGTLEIASWEEQPYVQVDDDRKLTSTTVTQKLHGDIEGEGTATWLAAYRADGTADYVGYQRIVGTIGDAAGSVVLRMTGGYDGAVARSAWEVIDGVGTGGLAGLTGSGVMEAASSGSPTYTLDYVLGKR